MLYTTVPLQNNKYIVQGLQNIMTKRSQAIDDGIIDQVQKKLCYTLYKYYKMLFIQLDSKYTMLVVAIAVLSHNYHLFRTTCLKFAVMSKVALLLLLL